MWLQENYVACVPCEKRGADGSPDGMKNEQIATPWRRGKAISYALIWTIYFKGNTYFEFL